MARIRTMSQRGDDEFSYDLTDEAVVAKAKELFLANQAKGMAAFKMTGTDGEIVREFDDKAEELLFVPQLRGG